MSVKVKSLDFFRKLNTDSDTTSSLGGLLTIVAFILVSALIINEAKLYALTEVKYQAVIDNDSAKTINIQIDISIKVPCVALSLDQQDELGVHRLDVVDTLKKIRLDSNGRSLNKIFGEDVDNYFNSDQQYEDLREAIKVKEQCRFVGYVNVNKVPGNFHISYHAQHQLMQRLFIQDQDSYQQLRLDHKIHLLQFGNERNPIVQLKRFPQAYQKYFTKFNEISQTSPEGSKKEYEYFLNILPSRFVNKFSDKTNSTTILYKSSITQAQAPKSLSEVDAIYFRYQINPVNMVYDIQTKSFYHFIVQLCAIIGGVFAVFGMINQILQKLD